MTGFIIGAALLLAATLLLLLWPLLRRAVQPGGERRADAAIIAAYRGELTELQADHASGTLAADAFESSRRELEQRLLRDLAAAPAGTPGAAPPARWSAWPWIAISALVVVVPALLYLQFGTLDALLPGGARAAAADHAAAAAAGQAGPITPAQVEAMVGKLEAHMKDAPNDAEGWMMLARSYNFLQRYEPATVAYAKAIALRPDDAQLLADDADALAMAHGRSLAGEPMQLIERALKIDPANPKALALAGTNAFELHDYRAAVGYWERATQAAGQQDPEFAAALKNSLAEARSLAGMPAAPAGAAAAAVLVAPAAAGADTAAGGAAATAPAGTARIRGRVVLAAALAAKAAPDDTVFVFARAEQGPRMPLALLRRQVKDLPLDFTLDESMAMMPQFTLAKFPRVVVGARISKSGNAAPQSGDLQGASAPVKVGADGVDIEISEVVP